MLEIHPPVVRSPRTCDHGATALTGTDGANSHWQNHDAADAPSRMETLDPALVLLSLWMAWPSACLAWQREVTDTWVALCAGGVPLDG